MQVIEDLDVSPDSLVPHCSSLQHHSRWPKAGQWPLQAESTAAMSRGNWMTERWHFWASAIRYLLSMPKKHELKGDDGEPGGSPRAPSIATPPNGCAWDYPHDSSHTGSPTYPPEQERRR